MSEAEALKQEGNDKFKAGQYAAAVDAYTRSIEQDPTQHLCFSNRSAAFLKSGESAAKALADAERCVELAPQFAKGYSRQAAALQDLERWEDATKACETGLKVTGDEALRKMLVEVRCRHFQKKIQGPWHGTVSEALGGYDQAMEFMDGGNVRVEAMGRAMMGTYWLDCEQNPHHLNIQVPMPEPPPGMPPPPPGMPPPPPVPYIVKHDEKGLQLCCPFMAMERPKSFTGPGYCLMVSGTAGSSDEAEKIARLSEDEKFAACTKELLGALPDTKLEEPKETEPDDVIREKLMLQVRVESKMYAVQKSFGEETVTRILAAAKGDQPGGVPKGLAGSPELKQLRDKLNVCGLLEQDPGVAPAKPSAKPSPAPPPNPARERSASSRPEASQTPDTPAQDDSGFRTAVGAGLIVATIAVVAGVLIYQRRRTAK